MSLDADVKTLRELVASAESLITAYPGKTNREYVSQAAKMLDLRNSDSRSTNGLLAIAIMKILGRDATSEVWRVPSDDDPNTIVEIRPAVVNPPIQAP